MIVRELVTKLGFKADDDKIKKFDRSITNLTSGIRKLAIGYTAALAGTFAFVKSSATAGDEVAKTSRRIGISSDFLQKYRFAAGQAGVSQGEFNQLLIDFNRYLGDAAKGEGRVADEYQKLGINIKKSNGELKDTESLFSEVLLSLEKIPSDAQRAEIAMKLFGRNGARNINLLASDVGGLNKEAERFSSEGLGLTDDELRKSEAFTDEVSRLTATFNALRVKIGAALVPQMQQLVERFQAFVLQNKELIIENSIKVFDAIIKVAVTLADIIQFVAKIFNFFSESVGGADKALKILLATFFGFKVLKLFGGSLRGLIGGLGLFAKSAIKATSALSSFIKKSATARGASLAATAAVSGAGTVGGGLLSKAGKGLKSFGKFGLRAIPGVGTALLLNDLVSITTGFDPISEGFNAAKGLAMGGGNSNVNNTNISPSMEININSAAGMNEQMLAEMTAKEITDYMSRELISTANNFPSNL